MQAPISHIMLYTKDIDEMAAFYEKHFGFYAHYDESTNIVELTHDGHPVKLLLHPAKGRREGQSCVKIIFDVKDVAAFCDNARKLGLDFGPVHFADGYEFANAKDPCNNKISVSGRAFREI